MTGWLRYPGNLAHHVSGGAKAIEGRKNGDVFRGVVTIVGRQWTSSCNRDLTMWHEWAGGRSPSAEWVDPVELRLERTPAAPRGFCLRCLYFASLDALVLDHRSLSRFAEAIESGGIPAIAWPDGLQ